MTKSRTQAVKVIHDMRGVATMINAIATGMRLGEPPTPEEVEEIAHRLMRHLMELQGLCAECDEPDKPLVGKGDIS